MRPWSKISAACLIHLVFSTAAAAFDALEPIDRGTWNRAAAAHLLERAGFGAHPQDIDRLSALGPRGAVRHLVYFEGVEPTALPPFQHSGIFEPGIDPFPPSRPATTKLAAESGAALGIDVRSGGNRPM